MPKTVLTPTLEIAYNETGPADGTPVVLMHGFPDDPHAFDGSLDALAERGYRVIVPWLRAYGTTRFLDSATPRSGQQAALGKDLLDFLDALGIERAILGGFDWGGRGAVIVSALWPERSIGLVTCGGYNMQNIAAAEKPSSAASEYLLWYQWYFNMERGENGLRENRREICKLLWRLWSSPKFVFDDATYDLTAESFDNPDFVDVVIHSYRHRHQRAAGDPALEGIEELLAAQPAIGVPTVSLIGADDGPNSHYGHDRHASHFTGRYERRILEGVGHFIPREAPDAITQAVIDLTA